MVMVTNLVRDLPKALHFPEKAIEWEAITILFYAE
jgi:hypothetical protein